MPVSISGTNGVTFPDSSLQAAAASPYVLKNRIINGGFQVWQRATSTTSVNNYTCADRWYIAGSANCTISKSANPTSPNGNYFLTWTTSASSTFVNILQAIESVNITDLRNQTVTLSAWVQTTAGSYTGSLEFTMFSNTTDAYTVSTGQITPISAPAVTPTGTWQQIKATFVIPATCVSLTIYLQNTSTQASGVTVNYADFQLEQNTSATPFERRLYNQELANCQRYYYKLQSNSADSFFGSAFNISTTQSLGITFFPVTLRTTPSALEQSGTAGDYRIRTSGNTNCSSVPVWDGSSVNNGTTLFTVASGLTSGQGAALRAVNSTAYLAWSAEL